MRSHSRFNPTAMDSLQEQQPSTEDLDVLLDGLNAEASHDEVEDSAIASDSNADLSLVSPESVSPESISADTEAAASKESEDEPVNIQALATEVNEVETKKYRRGCIKWTLINAAIALSLFGLPVPQWLKWTVSPVFGFASLVYVSEFRETKEKKLQAIRKEHGSAVLEQVIEVAAEQRVEMMLSAAPLQERLQERVFQKLDEKEP